MIGFTPIDAIARGEALLESAAQRTAQDPGSPGAAVQLLQARQQVTAGVRFGQTQDELSKKILDVLA